MLEILDQIAGKLGIFRRNEGISGSFLTGTTSSEKQGRDL